MRWLVATRNSGKAQELAALLARLGIETVPLPAEAPEPPEDGATFAENALVKARAAAEYAQAVALADDSGLCVDALGGRPGVRSARYAGVTGPGRDDANIEKLLAELRDVPEGARAARFCCALALAAPGGPHRVFEGTLEGSIGHARRGVHGFGFDPVFVLPDGRTLAECPPEEKDRISHRGKALARLAAWLLENPSGML